MLLRLVIAAFLLSSTAQAARAAPPKNAVLLDSSSERVIDTRVARDLLAEGIPDRAWKIYPARTWGYVSQVEGGFNSGGICVVTARVMMMQLTPTMKAMLFRPKKTSIAFDALPGATDAQCRDLAKAKLREAVASVMSGVTD